MENIVQTVTTVNNAVNGFVWGMPMLIMLVGTGILMTILTRAFQLSRFGYWMKKTIGGIFTNKHITAHTAKEDRSTSQFQSLCTALAATIGTGNISGVAAGHCHRWPRLRVLDVDCCHLRHDDQLFRKCAGHLLSPQE